MTATETPLSDASPSLILASGSRTRAKMLADAGLHVRVQPAAVDETPVKDGLLGEGAPPRDIADSLAELKARNISALYPEALVIGADQVLAVDGTVMSKSASRGDAAEQLASLAGRTHRLVSAVVLMRGYQVLWRFVDTATLAMRPLDASEIDTYLDRAGDAVLDSVGAYQLEGLGAQLFDRVSGDFFTILGLPLLPLLAQLRLMGVRVL
ncbi:Maf family protein [Eilatimonas milleporae]|uniref:Nucleoside triphosphate pyrophosphatase n=1 Tax=Eilatimonas milleporae TaxID=911205 RepID=A0A3M0BZM2_9PROT|nr:nucleoside triphosphate pyrophosphatase [Eilatimonas milleporae]RMB01837.1 septum formation protein [Eilatimonas milleporae]